MAAYGQILSKDVLGVPPHGGINVHASLLPKYRGAAPIARAIAGGETTTGVTIIRMTVGLDAGDMLAQTAVNIGPEETAGELEGSKSSHPLGTGKAGSSEVHRPNQNGHGEGCQTRPRARDQGAEAHQGKRGHRLEPPRRRGVQPRPRHAAVADRLHLPPPNRPAVAASDDRESRSLSGPVRAPHGSDRSFTHYWSQVFPDSLLVVAGMHDEDERSVIEVFELQPAGKRRMSAAEFVRGRRPQPGDHFGPESTDGNPA